jgi:hypothetical protein
MEDLIRRHPIPSSYREFNHVYESVGRHYHIPVLSWRDLAWHKDMSDGHNATQ